MAENDRLESPSASGLDPGASYSDPENLSYRGRGSVLSDVVNHKDIASFFSRAAMEKAYAYRAQGRVTGLKISDDLTRLSSRVKGAEAKIYSVDIALDIDRGRLVDLDGDCSCPMNSNCKHVAATLLEAIGKSDRRSEAASPSVPSSAADRLLQAAKPLPHDVINWLESVGKATRGDDYPGEITQRLLYCLNPSRDTAQPRVDVSLVSSHVGKGGAFGASVSYPSFENFEAARAAKYYRDSDIDILLQLSGRQDYSTSPQAYSAELLKRIVATGRAFWLRHDRSPLRWAEPRAGTSNGAGAARTVSHRS